MRPPHAIATMVPALRRGLLCLAFVATGCTNNAATTPEAAVTQFLAAMERSAWDSDARGEAFRLIDQGSREELTRRTSRAAALGRDGIEPWEMIAQGTYRLRFAVQRLERTGNLVIVHGASGQRAEVPVVQEEGQWRVILLEPTR